MIKGRMRAAVNASAFLWRLPELSRLSSRYNARKREEKSVGASR